jgi:hypothetical protein
MPHGSSSAAGDVGVERTGLRITRAMQRSAARGETSGPRPKHERCARFAVVTLSLGKHQPASERSCMLSHSGKAPASLEARACSPERQPSSGQSLHHAGCIVECLNITKR